MDGAPGKAPGIGAAIAAYVAAVKDQSFPSAAHSY
jgi:ketopantoate hydroxymethyltransferase